MSNFFNRFYLFSKLTTSLVLFVIIIFLSYLFISAYLDQNKTSDTVISGEIDSRFLELYGLVKQNSNDIQIVQDLIVQNQSTVRDIDIAIDKLETNTVTEQIFVELQKVSEENQELKAEMNSILSRIQNYNSIDKIINNEQQHSKKQIDNIVNLIQLKLDEGTDYIEEIKLLHDLSLNSTQLSYIEKLSILSNKKFIGLFELNQTFDLQSSEYLRYYYSEKNKNYFLKYFFNLVTIQPNINESAQDENVKLLGIAKKNLLNNDLAVTINQLRLINNIQFYFEVWIEEAEYYIAVNNILNKILSEQYD